MMMLPSTPYFAERKLYERCGFKWMLDTRNLIDFAIVNHAGVWEPHSTEVVKRVVKPNMTCIDVGANLGYYTLLLSRLVGPHGRVFAYEPMGEARRLLEHHVELNGLRPTVTVSGIALGDVDGLVEVAHPYAFRMADQPRYESRPETAQVHRLDLLTSSISAYARVDFIKIDTDGHDFQVLRGAKETIRRFDPIILIEIGDSTLRAVERPDAAQGDLVREIMVWLYHAGSHGYDFFYEYDLKPCLSPADLMARVDLEKYTTNLLCMPRGTVP